MVDFGAEKTKPRSSAHSYTLRTWLEGALIFFSKNESILILQINTAWCNRKSGTVKNALQVHHQSSNKFLLRHPETHLLKGSIFRRWQQNVLFEGFLWRNLKTKVSRCLQDWSQRGVGTFGRFQQVFYEFVSFVSALWEGSIILLEWARLCMGFWVCWERF